MQQPVFRGQKVRTMKLCVGFVTHKYRKLTLEEDFGMNYWQHSREVHCGARNHVWLEFSCWGANRADFVLDLTGIQFDMMGSKDMRYIHVCVKPQTPHTRSIKNAMKLTRTKCPFISYTGQIREE
ncbi:unnamed protein product [Durusdinium trenchii]|uniref:Uncharacterized protein n=1 Tax=Durusdinium trenchii TaxID=1381693 RepID=A0ABP0PZ65_9DINO